MELSSNFISSFKLVKDQLNLQEETTKTFILKMWGWTGEIRSFQGKLKFKENPLESKEVLEYLYGKEEQETSTEEIFHKRVHYDKHYDIRKGIEAMRMLNKKKDELTVQKTISLIDQVNKVRKIEEGRKKKESQYFQP